MIVKVKTSIYFIIARPSIFPVKQIGKICFIWYQCSLFKLNFKFYFCSLKNPTKIHIYKLEGVQYV